MPAPQQSKSSAPPSTRRRADSWSNEEDSDCSRSDSDCDSPSAHLSDGEDDRNASVFSETSVELDEDSGYPRDEEQHLFKEEESAAAVDEREQATMNDRKREELKDSKKPKSKSVQEEKKEERSSNNNAFESIEEIAFRNSISVLQVASRPTKEMIKCIVIRDQKSFPRSLFPRYTMYFQDGSDRIAMIAEKQAANRSANYHIFDMTQGAASGNLSKKSGNYMGKLRGVNESMRSTYALYNNNASKEQVSAFVFHKVNLKTQMKEGQLPRRLDVLLPPATGDGIAVPYRTSCDSDLLERFDNGVLGKIRVLKTKEPTFERGQYRLNFRGRVTTPSVKNFQVVDPADVSEIVAQFGRVTDDSFHLDYKYPMNAFQAFAMALAQFDL